MTPHEQLKATGNAVVSFAILSVSVALVIWALIGWKEALLAWFMTWIAGICAFVIVTEARDG